MGFFHLLRKASVLFLLRCLSYVNYRRISICSICSFRGKFYYFGAPGALIRPDARCPSCGCVERHRLFGLFLNKKENLDKVIEPILHFAPENFNEKKFRSIFKYYKTADLYFSGVDLSLDVLKLNLEDCSVGSVICFHVLEHVDDDLKALREFRRIIKQGGRLFLMLPVIEGWQKTYENYEIKDPHLRLFHFGQSDHVRYHGRDVRDRIRVAGFENIEEFTAEGEDVVTYALTRGEKLFICS